MSFLVIKRKDGTLVTSGNLNLEVRKTSKSNIPPTNNTNKSVLLGAKSSLKNEGKTVPFRKPQKTNRVAAKQSLKETIAKPNQVVKTEKAVTGTGLKGVSKTSEMHHKTAIAYLQSDKINNMQKLLAAITGETRKSVVEAANKIKSNLK